MILEHAVLPVLPGREDDFEAVFREARPLIARQPGVGAVGLTRSIESPQLYLLLVEWDSVEAHTEGFRRSADHARWRELLHPFYDPFPTVEHFVAVDVDPRASSPAPV